MRFELNHKFLLLLLIGLLFVTFLVSISVGRYSLPVDAVFSALFLNNSSDSVVTNIIFNIRLPRVIAAMLVGAALAVSGAAFQGLFKNPLVSSYQLGVSSGAGFGAALALTMAAGAVVVQGFAFAFGIIAVVASFAMSRIYKGSSALTLVLSGIIVGSFFSALVSFLQYIADPTDTLPAIVFWLMGSLSSVTASTMQVAIPVIFAGIVGIMLVRWRINILAMGEDEARALGVDLRLVVAIIVACCTIATASAVCISGIVGWVGLVIPHIGRMMVGPDYKKLIPVSALVGAAYLVIIDDIARTVTAGEIPLGILTALIGTPFFGYLLWKSKASWS
ncbi:MAG: iron ABC transporter permease [Candidatus Bathyarchaeota archaeon]|nr:iron ABC transporter permease [Candidatus Bathyarchaeota archaeon]